MRELTVAVVAKECVPGRVKTRLTPPLSPEDASRLAQASVDDTLSFVRDLPVSRRLLFIDGAAPPSAAGFDLLPQPDGPLDERLAHLFDAVDGPVLLVGMDTPQVSPAHVGDVIEWADDVDAWFGPAVDGGFWALALREPAGELVRGVTMSREDTGRRQRRRLVDAGLRVKDLVTLRDVDRVADARLVADEARNGRFARVWRACEESLHHDG